MSNAPPQVETKTLSCPLRPEFGIAHVDITWRMPRLPEDVRFGCHRVVEGATRIAAVGSTTVYVSDDGGHEWHSSCVEIRDGVRLDNAFILADGGVIAQGKGLRSLDEHDSGKDGLARLYLLDRDLRMRGDQQLGMSQWHGSSGIDEHEGTLVLAEYSENPIRWRGETPNDRESEMSLDSRVFRSTDAGETWETVLSVPSSEVRHFHTVRADRFDDGVWWASTGDRRTQCRTLRSDDDGRTWHDATERPTSALPEHHRARSWHSLHRYTDLAVTQDHLIWGTDDYLVGDPTWINDPEAPLGQRLGSRLCIARKDRLVRPQALGWVGNPVRSLIDVGPCWLLVTQAKRLELPRPQLVLVGKEEPFPLQEIGTADLFARGGPFTLSRSSRVAVDGRFFSYRDAGAVFRNGPHVLQWDIAFR